MHPTGEARPARRMLFLIAVMLAVSILPTSSTADDFPTGPGLDWTLPESHGLYITGADGSESSFGSVHLLYRFRMLCAAKSNVRKLLDREIQ